MTINFQELHNIYIQNIQMFPTVLKELSNQLGVSITSLSRIGVGLNPMNEYGMWAWVFPERDDKGNIIGLLERYVDGSKLMVKGSKRGLVYEVNHGTKEYEKKNWARVSTEFPCSLCGKADGCMYPEGEYEKPNAIVCVHISEGSDRPLSLGYLHILDKTRAIQRANRGSLLCASPHPVLVVEGASDVCAAMDLGFTAVGRPSAEGGTKLLPKLLRGKQTVVIGENDSGPGRAGMEKTFIALKDVCQSTKILPPGNVKDLRQWKIAGLTQQELLDYIEKTGDSSMSPDIFEDDIAYTIAKTWLKQDKIVDGKLLLRTFRKGFVQFDGHCYRDISDELIHGQLYDYLAGKTFIHIGDQIKAYKPTRAKLYDILDACNAFCPIEAPRPTWLGDSPHPNSERLITFQNGILDVNDYIKGKVTLHNPTPDFFTFTVLPYKFDENLNSKIWEEFINDIFNKDKDKIALLAQWFGYNCVPDLSYEKLMLFTGRPRSGKSTTLETLQAMLGNNNCCETSFQALAGAFGYQPLIGKLSAVIGDAKSPKRGEAEAILEKILHITGGDAISVNVKNKAALPLIRLLCRFTIAMNDLPAFTDHSRALEYRTNILTFNNSYVGREDRTLKHRLRQEAGSGKLINFALQGLVSLYKGNDFIVPAESAMTMNTFRELVSPIVEFADNCLGSIENNGVPADYLYDLWKWWCKREGRNAGFKSTFIRNLLSNMTNALQIREGKMGNMDRVIMGVKVTDWAEKEYLKGE